MLTCRNCISQQLEKNALQNMQWEDICVLQDFNILTKNAAKTSCLDSPLTHLRAILPKPHLHNDFKVGPLKVSPLKEHTTYTTP